MSGGVDSSVAALLTRRKGWECIGCTMHLFGNTEAGLPAGRTCCSLEDVEDARAVAWRLGMPFHVFNFAKDFRDKVMAPFAADYRRGVTPNPCIECNRWLKFDRLLRRAEELGCAALVTGHYARIVRRDGLYELKKALDPTKDQSYVLYMLTQEQLSRLHFPLGELTKAQVRALAAENGLVTAAKPDSQDICFVPDRDIPAMICRTTGRVAEPGDYVDTAGRVLGRHQGLDHYTVGQRRGLGLGGPEVRYVCALRSESNTVVLGPESALYSARVWVPDFHWIAGEAPAGSVRCRGRLRYRGRESACTATPRDNGVVLEFDKPQRAVTPGQSAVLYREDTVLGGGVIAEEERM